MVRLALFLLLFAAAATARAQYCSKCEGTLDKASRLCLPAKVEGARTIRLKASGNSRAAGYNAMRNRLAVTVSVHERGLPTPDADDDAMRDAVREVLDAHREAKLEMGGLTSLPVAGEPWQAQGAWMSWSEGLTDYVSLLWLLPRGERWLKVRATYVRPPDNTGEAAEFALGFVRSVTNAICIVR